MKLKSTSFYAIYPDGLVQLDGHGFSVNGRSLVVHKPRAENLAWDRDYKISEESLGFGIDIPSTRSRTAAVSSAVIVVSAISQTEWDRRMAAAQAHRKSLNIIGPK
jgi:hypothetical protein